MPSTTSRHTRSASGSPSGLGSDRAPSEASTEPARSASVLSPYRGSVGSDVGRSATEAGGPSVVIGPPSGAAGGLGQRLGEREHLPHRVLAVRGLADPHRQVIGG